MSLPQRRLDAHHPTSVPYDLGECLIRYHHPTTRVTVVDGFHLQIAPNNPTLQTSQGSAEVEASTGVTGPVNYIKWPIL